MLLFAVILVLAWAAEAVPTVSFPLNSQVPPVARVSQPFNFQFSSGTFAPASESLKYSLSGSPTWLSLDSPNRRLYGTPTEKDVGAPVFTIIADDGTGTVSMQVTLIVAADPAPKLEADVADVLAKAGKLSGSSSLSLLPSKQYTIQFPDDAFTSTSTTALTYYATLSDRSPLPSWVSFNPDSMIFSGTTSASPQTVDLMLIASDVTGFAGAWARFTLSISTHQLVFTNVEQRVNVTPGTAVSITDLRSQINLDGKPLSDSDFGNATANAPGWLSFDPETLHASGTAPKDFNSTIFTVSVADRFGDVANTTVQLNTASGLFRGDVGSLNAVIGEPAKFDLSTVVVKQPGLQVEVDLGAAARWLHFDENSLTIEGEIPESAKPQNIQGNIKVTTADGAQSDAGTFDIVVKTATATGSVGSAPRSTSPTSNASTTAESSETSTANLAPKRESADNAVVIAISVICVVLAVIAIVLGFLLYRRCRRARRPSSPKRRKEDISRPIYHEDGWQLSHEAFTGERDVEKGEGTVRHTEQLPPQIGTSSPLKKATTERRGVRGKDRESHTTSIGDGDREVLRSAIHSGDWSVAAGAPRCSPVSAGAGPSSRVQEDSPARGRRSRRSFRVHRDSQDSHGRRSTGLPTRRRVHGMGHGRASFGSPSQRFSSRRSRTASSYSSFSTLSTGMLSNNILSPTSSQFPAPPPSPNPNRYSNAENRKSVRMVPSSPAVESSSILADARPLDERRQSYIRNRATSRSPFFGGHGSSRGSSSHRPSTIGALAESLASGEGGDNSNPARSHSGSRPTTAGAVVSPTSERPRFPGSLRRKRTGTGKTARAYSGSPGEWRSETLESRGTIGPLAGRAPTESPRSSTILSGLSESTYATTEGTGTEREYSNGQSPIDDPMDIDDPEELRSPSNGGGSSSESSDGPATRPPAFMSSPLSPSALTIKKQQQQQSPPTPPPLSRHQRSLSRPPSTGKENDNPLDLLRRTPSPTKSFKSTITTSPFHRRARSTASPTEAPPLTPPPKSPYRPKTSLADLATITSRSSTGDAVDTPSLDDLNHAALLRNSALASQQRRASRDGSAGKGLSAAVRQQLRQRDSIINRGRHIGVGRSASGAGGAQQQQPTRFGARAEWGAAAPTGSKGKSKSKRWSVLDTVGGAEETDDRGGGSAGLRIPLSMISNVGNNANALAPSGLTTDSAGRPRTYAPGCSAPPAQQQQLLPSGVGLGNSGFREEEAVRLGEARARRPVSVEGTNRYSSLRGLRETAGAGAAGVERAGGWKTGEVSSPAPARRPGTAERESSVLGNEAFL